MITSLNNDDSLCGGVSVLLGLSPMILRIEKIERFE